MSVELSWELRRRCSARFLMSAVRNHAEPIAFGSDRKTHRPTEAFVRPFANQSISVP